MHRFKFRIRVRIIFMVSVWVMFMDIVRARFIVNFRFMLVVQVLIVLCFG